MQRVVLFRITPAWAGKRVASDCKGEKHEDHPRVGGEKAAALRQRLPVAGITPAWAGKRCTKSPSSGSSRDHPRVGGEKWRVPQRWVYTPGSPPRGRGKAAIPLQWKLFGGITPAWAGKRLIRFFAVYFVQDHPRVGGEKARPCIAPPPCRGSPPRGRGKETVRFRVLMVQGITPAWAGKSFLIR